MALRNLGVMLKKLALQLFENPLQAPGRLCVDIIVTCSSTKDIAEDWRGRASTAGTSPSPSTSNPSHTVLIKYLQTQTKINGPREFILKL